MERLFNLDPQLIHDTVLLMLSMLVMFTFLSYFLFNPVRAFLKKRQDKIQEEIDTAKQDKEDAAALKADYDGKLKGIEKEAEAILSEARKKLYRMKQRLSKRPKRKRPGS